MPIPRRIDQGELVEEISTDHIQTLISDLKLDFRLDLSEASSFIPENFLSCVAEAFSIIGKYKNSESISSISSSELQSDCLALQSHLVLNSRVIAEMMATSEAFEDTLKVQKSKTLLESKRLKKANQYKVSIEDLKDVTQVVLEDLIQESLSRKVAADFARFFYYTVKDFSAYLDRATARSYKFDPEVV